MSNWPRTQCRNSQLATIIIISEFKDSALDYIPHDREQNCTTAHQVHQNEQFFVKTVKGNNYTAMSADNCSKSLEPSSKQSKISIIIVGLLYYCFCDLPLKGIDILNSLIVS